MTEESAPLHSDGDADAPLKTLRPPTSGGVGEVLRVAAPLILAHSGHAIRLFCDRVMLTEYSSTALRASLPAGIMSFTCMALFMGVVNYASTFVAQYTGAKQHRRVGPAVWQAVSVALLGGLTLATLTLFSRDIFALFGHAPAVVEQEIDYFNILNSGAVFMLVGMGLATFWTGRGKTWTIMVIELAMSAVNIGINYVLIFGHFGLPEMGIQGAAIGTVASAGVGVVIFLTLLLSRKHRDRYDTLPKRTFDGPLLRRLIRFGLPTSIQFFLEIASFQTFIVLLGRYGGRVQEACNIAFSIEAMAFVPMIGIAMTASILVGQAIGEEDIGHAERSVRSCRTVTLIYMGAMTTMLVAAPNIWLRFFSPPENPLPAETMALTILFLRYVAAYLLFCGLYIVYHGAITGAGDTRFAMVAGPALAWGCFALPSYLIWRLGGDISWMWATLVVYVVLGGTVFYLRFRGGKWKKMRVIEHPPTPVLTDVPAVEIGLTDQP